ncbi:MAG: potassium transporter Kup [Gammaproteobacteria bacterium]|nr:potassium transporter Kup [Gammaproteobacteria bacterium]
MQEHREGAKPGIGLLALTALGVVYGDIGTSPLYAFKEAFTGIHGLAPTEANVLATLSAFFWAMTLIISTKYIGVVLKFDNAGEGGVLALTALSHRIARAAPRWLPFVVGAGVFAAALFYGDAIITPAISVLSAIEGLSVATPHLEPFVEPITLTILVVLFVVQRHGTHRIGGLFGPITVVWFLVLAVLGALSIADNPGVLRAVNPLYAIEFAVEHPAAAFLLLSAVFLALTGGEALYADMGHFGPKPVRLAWYGLVCPALLINYFGQGALILRSAEAVENPFYMLAPDWFTLPLVGLATAATVIASQATISGAYSMTLQASRLGYLPRVRILHTSDTERGQIYIPTVNWLMLLGVVVLVMEFDSSSALAAAYGIAVSGTMIVTTLLVAFVMLHLPGRARVPLLLALLLFGLLEILFFSSNMTKIASGGWMPLLLGAGIFTLLTTWKHGSDLVSAQRRKIDIPMQSFLSGPMPDVPHVPGNAVYLTSDPTLVPSALFHNLKHYKVMHETTVFLNVLNENIPYIDPQHRLEVKALEQGVYSVTLRFGFREEPDVPRALEGMTGFGLELEPMRTTFFVARSTIVEGPGGLPHWRSALYAWMTRQAEGAATYFKLPPNQVVEIGTQVML